MYDLCTNPSQACVKFTFSEIQSATNQFHESAVIGKGGFGKVYKGKLLNRFGSDTILLAIKRLNRDSKRTVSDFEAEVEWLSTLRHSNIVKLIGYCDDVKKSRMFSLSCPWGFVSSYEKEMMLVYDNVPNGTLKDHLNGLRSPLSWVQRLKICLDAARGLQYLHAGTGTKTGVIHRDVKSANILLDEHWTAKIADFGLSKMVRTDQSSVKGTFGYWDPTYFITGEVTKKSDIYSFGVVLLEVLCGRLAVDLSRPDEQRILVPWVQNFVRERNLVDLTDSNIRSEVSLECLQELYRIAEGCLHEIPKKRPDMGEVMSSLEFVIGLQEKSNNQLQPVGRQIHDTPPFPSDRENSDQGDPKLSSNSTNFSEVPADYQSPSPRVRLYTFADLRKATTDFSRYLLLGEGGFGKLYLGWIDRMTLGSSEEDVQQLAVAVKRLNQEGFQGHPEWQAEVNFSGHLVHPNIVRLLGYCIDEHEHLLVYEYMPNNSLDRYLCRDAPKLLSWQSRISIAIAAARGLAYLHLSNLVHGDFKSSNILLDEDFNAKVELPLLSMYETGVVPTMTCMGTRDYMDPEYSLTGGVSTMSDIYSFGVVLLEILTGRRTFDPNPHDGKHSLVESAMEVQTNGRKVKKIMDPRLEHDYPVQGASKCVALALRCVAKKPKDRPSSEEVVQSLEQIGTLYK